MRKLLIKFPSQIRISGWDFGSSARAMNQAGGKDSLMTYESVSKTQADVRKGRISTTERKSMSTKTSIKRIALVAVSALGLGMLTTGVAQAAGSAAYSTAGGEVTSVTATVNSKALRVGVQSQILVKYAGPAITAYSDDSGTASSGGFSATTKLVNPNMRVLSVPAAATTTTITPSDASTNFAVGAVFTNDLDGDETSSSSPERIGVEQLTPALNGAAVYAGIKWTPSHAGTYSFLFWDDVNGDGLLGGSTEKYTIGTFVVGDSINTVTASTVINNGTTVGTSYSAVVKVALKDANGNATVPSGADSVKVVLSGSAKWYYSFVAGSTVSGTGTNTAYLTSADFDKSGNAYLGLYDNTAETVIATPSVIGGLVTPAVTTTSITFLTPTSYFATNSNAAVTTDVTSTVKDSDSYYVVPVGGSADLTLTGAVTSASKLNQIGIVESAGDVFGDSDIKGVTVVTTGTDGTYNLVSPAISSAAGTTSIKYVLGGTASTLPDVTSLTTTSGGNSFAIGTVLNNSANAGVTVSPSAPTIATGGVVNLVVTVEDSYGNARAGIAVTPSISGRNTGKQIASAITNADGIATFTYTDTNASGVTTTLTDTVTFTTTSPLGASVTGSATVTYVTGLTVSAVTVTTSDSTKSVANLTTNPSDILAGKAGAATTANAIYAYVTTSSGAIAGIPVTFSVAGTGAAIPSTMVTVYTDSTGKATSAVYGWIAGKYTVTATSGGVSGTGVHAFSQQSTSEARTVSATSAGSVVTASVKDRFGNGIAAARVYATATGGAYFGNGTTSTYGDTGLAGTVDFVVNGSGSVTVSTTNPADATQAALGQTNALKGYATHSASATTLATLLFTASAAGDATTIETGVGASYDAAGVASASVDVATVGSSDSIDAANEATDAANAATDAANAAAEAADAATAAAQDAQAAVAALATEVAAMISGIKAQIIRLTNLVVKIQKKVNA